MPPRESWPTQPKAATSGEGAIDLTAAYNLASIPGTKTYNAAVGNGTLVQARGADPLPCTTPDSVQANVGTVALTGIASGGLCSSVYNLPNALSTDTERDIFGNYVNRYTRQTVEKSWHAWVSVPANCGVVTTTCGESWLGNPTGNVMPQLTKDASGAPSLNTTQWTTDWLGHRWTELDWTGHTWNGHRWTWDGLVGHTWTGHTWSGNRWSGDALLGNRWSGNRWSGHTWRDNAWG